MQFEDFSFGSIRIDGITHERDVVIDRGEIRKRKKKPSKKFRDAFGHTPLSMEEDIPWKCGRLVVGTGADGRRVVVKVGNREAAHAKFELFILTTTPAIEALKRGTDDTAGVMDVAGVSQDLLARCRT